jgi:hypothetical protein
VDPRVGNPDFVLDLDSQILIISCLGSRFAPFRMLEGTSHQCNVILVPKFFRGGIRNRIRFFAGVLHVEHCVPHVQCASGGLLVWHSFFKSKKGAGTLLHVLHVCYSFRQKCSKLGTYTQSWAPPLQVAVFRYSLHSE